MPDLAKPLVAAVRSLARHPAVTLPAILVLALGIGATTALFSYLAALLWPRLEAPEPERIVEIYSGTEGGAWTAGRGRPGRWWSAASSPAGCGAERPRRSGAYSGRPIA